MYSTYCWQYLSYTWVICLKSKPEDLLKKQGSDQATSSMALKKRYHDKSLFLVPRFLARFGSRLLVSLQAPPFYSHISFLFLIKPGMTARFMVKFDIFLSHKRWHPTEFGRYWSTHLIEPILLTTS